MGFFSGLTGAEQFFFIIAVIGSLFYVMKAVSLLMGLGGDSGGIDLDGDGIPDIAAPGDVLDTDGVDIPDATNFAYISLEGISAFAMMFGWVGYAMMHASHFGFFLSFVAGAAGGVFSAWVVSKIHKFFFGLKSAGNERISSAMFKEATVYLTIPAEGVGQVQVVVDGRLRVCDAISSDKVEIKTGEKVTVSFVNEQNVLEVKPLLADKQCDI